MSTNSKPSEDLVIPWKIQEEAEGCPSWIKHKYPLEIYEPNSKLWYNAIIYDVLPYNPSKKSKKYNFFNFIFESRKCMFTI